MIMVCPVCDGQGNIYKAKILDLGIIIKICDECEACWNQNQIISIESFKRLTLFLEEHHLTYKDAKIKDLEYVKGSRCSLLKYLKYSNLYYCRIKDYDKYCKIYS